MEETKSEIKLIAKNTAMLSMPKILKFFVGIVRAKLIAIYLGTQGAGIIAQLQNILQNISSFTTAGMPDGMVKQIASANAVNAKKQEIASIIKTFASTIGVITIVVYLLGYLFSKELTQYVFGNTEYHNFFLIGFVALPIMILSSSSFAIIKAYKQIKLLMFAEIAIMGINFILFIILIYFYRLKGAVIYITLSFLTTFMVYRYIAQKKILKKAAISLKDIVNAKFVKSHFKELMVFVGATLTAGVYQIFVDITTRSIVVNNLGVEKIGVYSPIVSWAGLFTGFILPSLTTYLFPRISEAKTDKEIILLVNDVFRLMTFVVLPFVIIGITTRNYIIPLFYSTEFLEATIYLPYHFIGIFFTIWCFCFAQIFAPTGRLKYFIPIILFNNTLALILVYFLVPSFDLWGWMARFTISPVIAFLIYYYFWNKTINFRFTKANKKLLTLVLSGSILLLIFQNHDILYLISFLFLTGMWYVMEKREKTVIVEKLKTYIKYGWKRK